MLRKHIYIALTFLASVSLSGCIKNDIPYPRIQPDIVVFEVENQIGASTIDVQNRTVKVVLNEEADIANVKVTQFSISDDARLVEPQELKTLDLTQPATITLALYQDYEWTILATQNIARFMVVENQIGTSVIDETMQRVVFTIPDNVDLTKIHVDTIKLGQVVSTMTPNLNNTDVDFTNGVAVDVTTFGQTQTWHIYPLVTQTTVFTNSVDAWTCVAWVYGSAEAGKDNGFEYRTANSDEWIQVPQSWIQFDGGSMTARIIHLQPETEYAVRAYSNEEKASELVFTTQSAPQMPNNDFEDWSVSATNKKLWQPWGEGQTPYWGTGNNGATTAGGESNVIPTTDTPTGTGQAALLKTELRGLFGFNKLAAGSIFAGSYVRTDGTNGVLSFGRVYNQRPTKLKGSFKYNSALITDTNADLSYMMGKPDTCVVWVALIDSAEPFEIRTNPNNQHLFDPDGDEVIAYGIMQAGYSVEQYTPFEVILNYKSTSRIPNYILCVSSSSKYGDYFTGGQGSQMWVDDYVLEYDYDDND